MRLGPTLLLVALFHVCHGVSINPYKADSLQYPDRNVTSGTFHSINTNTIDSDDTAQAPSRFPFFAAARNETIAPAPSRFDDAVRHWAGGGRNLSAGGNLSAESLKTETPLRKKVITVGYLAAIKGELKERQGLTISGAVQMAIDHVGIDF